MIRTALFQHRGDFVRKSCKSVEIHILDLRLLSVTLIQFHIDLIQRLTCLMVSHINAFALTILPDSDGQCIFRIMALTEFILSIITSYPVITVIKHRKCHIQRIEHIKTPYRILNHRLKYGFLAFGHPEIHLIQIA